MSPLGPFPSVLSRVLAAIRRLVGVEVRVVAGEPGPLRAVVERVADAPLPEPRPADEPPSVPEPPPRREPPPVPAVPPVKDPPAEPSPPDEPPAPPVGDPPVPAEPPPPFEEPPARLVVVEAGPAAPRFRVELDGPGGRVLVNADFGGREARFTLEELEALPAGPRWVREALASARAATRALGGVESARGFVFPASLAREVLARFGEIGEVAEGELLGRLRASLEDFTHVERVPAPSALAPGVALREYQRHGLDWLAFLRERGFGGILADDMGLGKTLQALCAVARAKEREGRAPSLVVCPASLLGGWQGDAARFLPSLAVARLAGPRRAALYDQRLLERNVDVALVSYESMRADADALSALAFRFVVFDEAQRLKNPRSRLHEAARRLRGETRLALSGTPVETRLRDLWALTAVVLPGYLGTEAQFARRYEDGRETQALAGRLRPFVLHRKKTTPEIAAELPAKVRMPARVCPMLPAQRALYEDVIAEARPEAKKAVEAESFRVPPNVLAAITRLKLLCGHPEAAGGRGTSSKFEELFDLLAELLDDPEARVLVFTQYVLLLDLVSAELARRGVSHFTLTGAQPLAEREANVAAFNAPGEERRVFLLSLKAGGVGLNLQAANHVVHFDRWWNPAVEMQAEDRAHRMGQKRTVLVHRFLVPGTIEERIEELLAERADLIGEVLEEHEAVSKTLTREDLIAIFGLSDVRTEAVAGG